MQSPKNVPAKIGSARGSSRIVIMARLGSTQEDVTDLRVISFKRIQTLRHPLALHGKFPRLKGRFGKFLTVDLTEKYPPHPSPTSVPVAPMGGEKKLSCRFRT